MAQMKFAVRIMPPRRPGASEQAQKPEDEPMHTVAVPAEASDTFADVWNTAQGMFERFYGAEKAKRFYYHKMQDSVHADLGREFTVGSMYHGQLPRDDMVLYLITNAVDREDTLPIDSHLRPRGWKRPRLTEEEEQAAEHRRRQKTRYGAAVSQLNPDAPVMSREMEAVEEQEQPQQPQQPQQRHRRDSEHRVDGQGFAIPEKIKHIKKPRRKTAQPTTAEEGDDVLVRDSQSGQAAPTRPSPLMMSGGLGPADRNVTSRTVVCVRPSPFNPTPENNISALLTPESRLPSSQEPPESAQRPKPSVPPTSARTFEPAPVALRQAPGREMAVEDPIEDDALLDGIDEFADRDVPDEYFLQASGEVPRGRSRSHSLRSVDQASGSGQPAPHSPAAANHPDQPASQNAFAVLRSSQASSKSRSKSASKRWTAAEDKKMKKGIRLGLGTSAIVSRFSINRSGAAARNRRRELLTKQPELEDPNVSMDFSSDAEDENPPKATPAPRRKPWTGKDVATIQKAVADGLGSVEIQATYFPDRSTDAVGKKFGLEKPQLTVSSKKKKNMNKKTEPPQVTPATQIPSSSFPLRSSPLERRQTRSERQQAPDRATNPQVVVDVEKQQAPVRATSPQVVVDVEEQQAPDRATSPHVIVDVEEQQSVRKIYSRDGPDTAPPAPVSPARSQHCSGRLARENTQAETEDIYVIPVSPNARASNQLSQELARATDTRASQTQRSATTRAQRSPVPQRRHSSVESVQRDAPAEMRDPNAERAELMQELNEELNEELKEGLPSAPTPPTDKELWKRAKTLVEHPERKQDVKDVFEGLKYNRDWPRAYGAGLHDEAEFLTYKLHLHENDMATRKGDRLPWTFNAQHPDGPAQIGDFSAVDEDILRTHNGTYKRSASFGLDSEDGTEAQPSESFPASDRTYGSILNAISSKNKKKKKVERRKKHRKAAGRRRESQIS